MVTKIVGHAPPSAVLRAALSMLLLLGFYAVVFGVAAGLVLVPIAWVSFTKVSFFAGALFLFCWTPAALLIVSLFRARRSEFVPPPRRLGRQEAPAFFAAVDDLARQANTAPPEEVYLDCMPNLSVTEVGGFWKTRRVMVVGGPLFGLLSVDQLRAGIAHELGHFMGGDTRLTTFSVQTHALFVSVLNTTERDPFRAGTQIESVEAGLAFARTIGDWLVAAYGRLFLRLTRPIDRRQELAADALAASLTSVRTTASTLERVEVDSQLYVAYVNDDVGHAVRHGAMPTDLMAGFHRMREQLFAGDGGRKLVDAAKASQTDPYDTHPALGERLRALEALPNMTLTEDDRPASALLLDSASFDAWLVQATRERVIAAVLASDGKVGTVRDLPWAGIAAEAFAPGVKEAARKLAARLHPKFPSASNLGAMYAMAFRHFSSGKDAELAQLLEPAHSLDLSPEHAAHVATLVSCHALGTLLQGALLEAGATVEDSVGSATLTLRFEGERIDVLAMFRIFGTDRAAGLASLSRWADRFEHN